MDISRQLPSGSHAQYGLPRSQNVQVAQTGILADAMRHQQSVGSLLRYVYLQMGPAMARGLAKQLLGMPSALPDPSIDWPHDWPMGASGKWRSKSQDPLIQGVQPGMLDDFMRDVRMSDRTGGGLFW